MTNYKSQTYQREVTIVNPYGIHARPAAAFVKVAEQYVDNVTVENNSKKAKGVSGKSIMGLMTLGAGSGDKIKITVTGNGTAKQCLNDLVYLVEKEFIEMDKKGI